ncbi:MAG: carbohydrate kinase family protein [Anaerolineaceae bacterium]|jgi:sugar/nucleoside kinase (ribokinase family)
MKNDVGLIGPLNVDLLLRGQAPTRLNELTRWSGPSDVALCAAGSAGYIAQDLVKFGLKTSLFSTLADDLFGDAILRILNEAGLNCEQVNRQPNTLSGIGIYMLLFGSKKRPLTYRMPTHLPWPKPFSKVQKEFLLEEHRHIHCAGYLHFPDMWSNEIAALFKDAKAKGLSTSLDPQFVLFPVSTPWMEPLKEMLQYTDYLFVDEDEARKITLQKDLRSAATVFQSLGPALTIVKRGEFGSMLITSKAVRELPAARVSSEEIVDSIGAGDAFDTGMIFSLLQRWPEEQCQKFATLAAASTLKGWGGTEALATVKELKEASQVYQFE